MVNRSIWYNELLKSFISADTQTDLLWSKSSFLVFTYCSPIRTPFKKKDNFLNNSKSYQPIRKVKETLTLARICLFLYFYRKCWRSRSHVCLKKKIPFVGPLTNLYGRNLRDHLNILLLFYWDYTCVLKLCTLYWLVTLT